MPQPAPAECTVCHGYDSPTCPNCLGTGQQPAQGQPLDLAPIAAREAAATPGPWENHPQYGHDFYAYLGGEYLRGVGSLNFGDGDDAEADLAFILGARQDIPALLVEVRRLRAELAARDAENAKLRAELAARPGCPDPIECDHEAELGQVREQVAQWQRRATRAEGAMRHALWMSPLAYNNETAEQMTTRFRLHIEATYPDLVTRYSHQPVEVYQWADGCSCLDDGSNEYENAHSETDDNGDAICSRTPLGRVCDSCKDEDGDGPEWLPDGVLWPCPPIAALNQLTDAGVLAAAMTTNPPAPAARPAD